MRHIVASARCLIRGKVHRRDACARVRRDRGRWRLSRARRNGRRGRARTCQGYRIEATLTEVSQERQHLRRVFEPACHVSAVISEGLHAPHTQISEIRPHIAQVGTCTLTLPSRTKAHMFGTWKSPDRIDRFRRLHEYVLYKGGGVVDPYEAHRAELRQHRRELRLANRLHRSQQVRRFRGHGAPWSCQRRR